MKEINVLVAWGLHVLAVLLRALISSGYAAAVKLGCGATDTVGHALKNLKMEQTLLRAFTCVTTIIIGVCATTIVSAWESTPTKIEGASDRIGTSHDFGPLPLATAAVNPHKIDSKQPSDKSALRNNREKVEVLARSITFPGVLRQGEDIISVEYRNASVLCLDAAFYAGRVQGLMWAMDRDIVVEHNLQWTIDAADALFYGCLPNLLGRPLTGQKANDREHLKDVKKEVTEQIQNIQEALRYARNVKIKAAPTFCR